MVCTHEGSKEDVKVKHVDQGAKKQKRKRASCRVHCMARVGYRFVAGIGYEIYKFIEGHTHKLASEGYQHLLKVHRNIDYGHQFFMAKCFKANIGAVRSFKIYSELVGGVDDAGCRKIDFKNHSRDVKSWANGVDVQILIEKFKRKRSANSDVVSIENYKIFGHAISFDATYNTIRYILIFTPFTGKDDHGRCVTFGAGLISREDEESYSWILSTFVKCMGSQPTMIITDQDLGMRAAIAKVLTSSRHRFCMWHITMKMVEKLSVPLRDDPDFKLRFDEVVWSDAYEPCEFEDKWNALIEEFNLVGHKWFDEMFRLRSFWIPAFFRDLHMSALFRTTSLSESENSFFKRHLNKHASLSELYVLFETAIETQRHDHDALTLADETCFPELRTILDIEKHAAPVYTNTIFLEVKKEIQYASAFCTIPKCIDGTEGHIYDVDEDASCTQFEVERNTGKIHCLQMDKECIVNFQTAIQSLRKMLQDFLDEQSKKSCNASSSSFKERLIENFYGSSLPSVVTVFPPDVAKTKGSCSRKKSRLEAEAKRAQKPKRLCKKCNTLGYHDSRNCDKVNAKNKNVSDSDA
ncbi:protein FAR1-RELATED SEQUENCE 5-like [Salvia miltiorrhiza]|uniref:protein FAR1-RELATED SEQUENCE 5-like n=1 Tax=Salvia miltiorrhiza TaxID=226208 RepID=UPI0025ABD668|nr:protein FAR1-RELATED SEQUENCE 5-like [Salvia miltiorrhiza]